MLSSPLTGGEPSAPAVAGGSVVLLYEGGGCCSGQSAAPPSLYEGGAPDPPRGGVGRGYVFSFLAGEIAGDFIAV